jgi:hypothetical protein
MAELDDDAARTERAAHPAGDAADGGISELQARLNELQRSVELLGTQGVWASRGAGDSARPAPEQPPPPPAPPPVQPPIQAAPAATNGHTDEEPGISGPEASVAMVDAGPFADLVELRHFEDDLSSLTAVHDVRVRRYGRGRAMIEVGMAGPFDLALELPHLGLPMDVVPAGPDELVVEFAPPPAHDPEIDPPVEDEERA